MAEQTVLSVSLREYKKEIDSLKGSLLGLQKGSEEYATILGEVRDKEAKLKEVMSDVKQTAEVSENSMNALKQQLKEMKQEAGNLDIGSDRFRELSQSIAETTETLKTLEAEQGTYSRNVGNYESGVVSLKQQLKEMKAEMAEMLANGAKPTDAAFVELAKKAGNLADAMGDANAVVSHFANDTRGLSTVIDLAKTGTAAFGVYKGALSIFGIEGESVEKTMQTMTTVMATLNSLQTLQTALVDKASITYRAYQGVIALVAAAKTKLGLGITESTVATEAETVATTANTTAMGANTVATGAATVATNLFKKALIATGIGAIVVLIGELVAHWEDLVKAIKGAVTWIGKVTGLIKEQSAAEKAAAKAAEQHKREMEALAKQEKELKSNNIELTGTYVKLQAIWRDTKTIADRQKFVQNYKQEMSNLGVEINNVSDAEAFFSKAGADMFAQGIELRAKLTIAQSKLINALKKEEEAFARGEWGPSVMNLQEEKQKILNEIVSLTTQITKITPRYASGGGGSSRSGGGGSSRSTTSNSSSSTSTDKKEVDVSGKLDALEKMLERETAAIDYFYDELESKGELTLAHQIERATKIYEKTKEILNNEIIDREAQLKKVGITAEQKKDIEEEIYDIRQKLEENERNYTLETNKIILKERQETLKKIQEQTKQHLEQENKNYKDSGLISHYVENLKDTTPEVAAAIVKALSVDDATKQQIIESLDKVNGESADARKEWYMQEEEDAHQHQIRLIEINKEALVQMGDELGEDSDAYLNLRKEIWKQEENEAQRHADALLKIEKQHAKETTKTNKSKVKDWISLGKGIGDVMDNVADFMKDDIERQQEAGKITEEEARKRFETVKAFQITAAVIDTISGAISAFMGTWKDDTIQPVFLKGALAAVNAAAVTAAGIGQIANLKATQFGSSSVGGSGSVGRSATSIDFSGVNVNPILDENADINRLSTLTTTTGGDNRVYILQSDITDSNEQVQIRQNETTF